MKKVIDTYKELQVSLNLGNEAAAILTLACVTADPQAFKPQGFLPSGSEKPQ